MEPPHQFVHHQLVVGFEHIDGHDGAHHLFDVVHCHDGESRDLSGQPAMPDAFLAASMADCSDCT